MTTVRPPVGPRARGAFHWVSGGDGFQLIRPAVEELTAYQPGKPVEDVQRELGLERVVKLASNEGPFPPFPAALEAMARAPAELNRYPDGGIYRLHEALAARHGVAFEEVCVGAGADGCLDMLSQAMLDPGDEIVCGWPSFPSYLIYARQAGRAGATHRAARATTATTSTRSLAAAVGPRTKLVYVCHPNNPTGTMNTARRARRVLRARARPRRSSSSTRRTSSTSTGPTIPDAVEEYVKDGRRVVVLRTFSKIYGLAGAARRLRGRAAGRLRGDGEDAPAVRPDDHRAGGRAREPRRRGRGRPPARAQRRGPRAARRARCASTASTRLAGAVGNFVYVDVGEDAADALRAAARARA